MEEKLKEYQNKMSSWLTKNRYSLFVVALVFLFLKILTYMPYLNLLFKDPFYVFGPVFFLAVMLLNIDPKKIFIAVVIMFLISAFSIIILQYDIAEGIANYIYVILLASTIKVIY